MYFKNVYSRLILILQLVLGILFLPVTSHADTKFGLDFGTLQENRSATELSSVGRTVYDGYLNLKLKKDSPVSLLLGYMYIDSVENYTDSTYVKMQTTNYYVGGVYHFFRTRPVSLLLSVGYIPTAKLILSQVEGSEKWDGTGSVIKMSVNYGLLKDIKISGSLSYVSDNFDTRVSGDITSKTSINQSYFSPMLGLAYEY